MDRRHSDSACCFPSGNVITRRLIFLACLVQVLSKSDEVIRNGDQDGAEFQCWFAALIVRQSDFEPAMLHVYRKKDLKVLPAMFHIERFLFHWTSGSHFCIYRRLMEPPADKRIELMVS